MAQQLPADLYIRPAGVPAADRHPPFSRCRRRYRKLPGIDAVDRLRAYENHLQRTAGHARRC